MFDGPFIFVVTIALEFTGAQGLDEMMQLFFPPAAHCQAYLSTDPKYSPCAMLSSIYPQQTQRMHACYKLLQDYSSGYLVK